MLEAKPTVSAKFHDAMDADSSLIMHAVLKDHPAIFQGLTSLVDVGGGRGTAAAAIAMACPDIKCTVLDLPHVVAQRHPNMASTGCALLPGICLEEFSGPK